MKDSFFVDSNVLVYLAEDNAEKKIIAATLLADRPVISTQVVNENISTLLRKKIPMQKALEHAGMIRQESRLKSLSFNTTILAASVFERYRYSWYDCLNYCLCT